MSEDSWRGEVVWEGRGRGQILWSTRSMSRKGGREGSNLISIGKMKRQMDTSCQSGACQKSSKLNSKKTDESKRKFSEKLDWKERNTFDQSLVALSTVKWWWTGAGRKVTVHFLTPCGRLEYVSAHIHINIRDKAVVMLEEGGEKREQADRESAGGNRRPGLIHDPWQIFETVPFVLFPK